jgi:predicted flap endonuclease-1-like 5' DNA nuclease
MTQNAILIIAALIVAVMIVWILRSRGRDAARHVDQSVTAVGAAAEAARNVAEDVAGTIEDSLAADVAASGARADDVGAVMSNAAAIMATGGAAAGAVTLTDIGVPTTRGEPDNLRQLKGVGPKLAALLNQLGITRFDQIAAWSEADVARVDSSLGTFKGRIVRDDWIEQAGYLARGDIAGFEAKFGKLDNPGNG